MLTHAHTQNWPVIWPYTGTVATHCLSWELASWHPVLRLRVLCSPTSSQQGKRVEEERGGWRNTDKKQGQTVNGQKWGRETRGRAMENVWPGNRNVKAETGRRGRWKNQEAHRGDIGMYFHTVELLVIWHRSYLFCRVTFDVCAKSRSAFLTIEGRTTLATAVFGYGWPTKDCGLRAWLAVLWPCPLTTSSFFVCFSLSLALLVFCICISVIPEFLLCVWKALWDKVDGLVGLVLIRLHCCCLRIKLSPFWLVRQWMLNLSERKQIHMKLEALLNVLFCSSKS